MPNFLFDFMRIYAVADLHGKEKRKERAVELASTSDLTIICGDITHFGPAEHAKLFLDKIGKEVKTFALPGNCDEWETIDAIEASRAENLHRNRLEFKGFTFFGYGGSPPSSIKTIFEDTEEEIYGGLKKIAKEGGILCTHAPPRGHLDRAMGSYNIGSSAVLRILDEKRPILNLFGHVHESSGSERYGDTWLINCSAGLKGSGCYVDLGSAGVEGITFLD